MSVRSIGMAFLFGMTLAASARVAAQATPDTTAGGEIVLLPGDVIGLTVWRRPEFTGEYLVSYDGSISHPLLREVQVAGISLREIDKRLASFLSRYDATPAFVVAPLIRVAVGGEVRQPQVYNVPPGTTVAEAIARAGGAGERGDLQRVKLVRGTTAESLDLTILDDRTVRLQVRSGDQIMVGRRRNFLRDVAGPTASVIAAAVSLISIFVQLGR